MAAGFLCVMGLPVALALADVQAPQAAEAPSYTESVPSMSTWRRPGRTSGRARTRRSWRCRRLAAEDSPGGLNAGPGTCAMRVPGPAALRVRGSPARSGCAADPDPDGLDRLRRAGFRSSRTWVPASSATRAERLASSATARPSTSSRARSPPWTRTGMVCELVGMPASIRNSSPSRGVRKPGASPPLVAVTLEPLPLRPARVPPVERENPPAVRQAVHVAGLDRRGAGNEHLLDHARARLARPVTRERADAHPLEPRAVHQRRRTHARPSPGASPGRRAAPPR